MMFKINWDGTDYFFDTMGELESWVWNTAGDKFLDHGFLIQQKHGHNWGEPDDDNQPKLRTQALPKSPYPSWTWNDPTRQWEPPVPRPSSPKSEYDLIWNEDTQAWGLTGISLTRVNENGECFVNRKYFNTWNNLIEYLYKIDTVKYVMFQILEQEKLQVQDRKIITPHEGKFICLQVMG